MRTLVMNLTRFGDLLQSQAAVSSLARGGAEVGLVCLENFAPAAALLRDVDRVFPLPAARLLARLDAGWKPALATLREWGGEAAAYGAAQVVNLTSTLPARLLARTLGTAPTLGFGLDEWGFCAHSSPWAAFLQAATRHRGCSPFNLVDLFRRVAAGSADPAGFGLAEPGPGARRQARDLLAAAAPAGTRGFVALQPGASAEARRWPEAAFRELGERLWAGHGLCPVLLGATSEAPLGQAFAAAGSGPFIDLMGRTSLPLLAAVLTECRLLTTNDTGTMHLAAGLGVPVAALFLATAQPWDTGPYLAGSLGLEPDLDCHPCAFNACCTRGESCRETVGAPAVAAYVDAFLRAGAWGAAGPQPGVRAWEARPDAHGFMNLVSLSGHEGGDRTGWIRLQRSLYRQFLDDEKITPRPDLGALLGTGLRAEAAALLGRAGQLLLLLREQAKALSRAPLPPIKRKFLANWQTLSALWGDDPRFSVLGDLWREQSQQLGENIDQLYPLLGRYRDLALAWQASLAKNGTVVE
jgi:ADP-heptose:LPS heptosyltransferase